MNLGQNWVFYWSQWWSIVQLCRVLCSVLDYSKVPSTRTLFNAALGCILAIWPRFGNNLDQTVIDNMSNTPRRLSALTGYQAGNRAWRPDPVCRLDKDRLFWSYFNQESQRGQSGLPFSVESTCFTYIRIRTYAKLYFMEVSISMRLEVDFRTNGVYCTWKGWWWSIWAIWGIHRKAYTLNHKPLLMLL